MNTPDLSILTYSNIKHSDAWKPSDLCRMTSGFFDALAEIWMTLLNVSGPTLASWGNIRDVALPKEDGGWRPISVASAIWRIGMSTVISALTPWLETLLPDFILSGLPGRSLAENSFMP